jgi:DNA-binding beta-propeller fold protein YncE
MYRLNIERRLEMKWSLIRLILIAALVIIPKSAGAESSYEVWAIDQSNSPGLTYGGTLYIYDGKDLERGAYSREAEPEKIDLGRAAAQLCYSRTLAYPVRPHMMAMNASQTHAIISFVASGHVLIMDARTRSPIECIRTTAGAGGSRQVHFAIPSPDETYIAVANQNGKLFERIDTDYVSNHFTLNTAAMIDLANCSTPNGIACEQAGIRPDNAPICPIVDATSQFVFVTLRGGGLFVVDARQTPMQIVAEYDINTVHPNGCLGAQVGGKMYIDSGGGTSSHLYGADLYAFPVTGFSAANPPNTPAPNVVLSDPSAEADAHGASLTKHARYLWVADRGRNFIWVINTSSDELVKTIGLEGPISADPTPDLLAISPNGSHAFLSLRGPNPLTADPHVSTGRTPGVGVMRVIEAGQSGVFESIARVSNLDSANVERADVHALTIRLKD